MLRRGFCLRNRQVGLKFTVGEFYGMDVYGRYYMHLVFMCL